jgi:hypothetical protein
MEACILLGILLHLQKSKLQNPCLEQFKYAAKKAVEFYNEKHLVSSSSCLLISFLLTF